MPLVEFPKWSSFRKLGDEKVTHPGYWPHGRWAVESVDQNGRKTGKGVHGYLKVPNGVVIAIIHKGAILLTMQERFLHGWGLEIPGGGIDPYESPRAAAARECTEETGVTVNEDDLVELGRPIVESVINTNTNRVFVIELDKVTNQEPLGHNESGETIDKVVWLTFDEVERAVDEGAIRDGKTLTALYQVSRYLRKQEENPS